MSHESRLFFLIAVPVGLAGTVVGTLMGLGDTGVFLAGMGPFSLVMLVFMLRESKHEPELDHGVKPPSHRRA